VLPDTNYTWIVFGGKEGDVKEGGREGGREGVLKGPIPTTPGSCLAARKVRKVGREKGREGGRVGDRDKRLRSKKRDKLELTTLLLPSLPPSP